MSITKASKPEALTPKQLLKKQQSYFQKGHTKPVSFRLKMLNKLHKAVKEHELDIYKALALDFRKSQFETYLSEIGLLLEEIAFISKRLDQWAAPQKVDTPVTIHPGSSYVHPVPYGSALIIGPWNYPFQLAMIPLVGAMAAGNCAIVKPSELTPHTSALIAKIISENFDPQYIAVVEGGIPETQALLAEPFDYIFFTGSVKVGKIVAEAAAKHLTPCTLELGGKSPCIVAKDANIDYAAKRIVWGKFLNGGQTCVAPDYIAVDLAVKDDLIFKMRQYIREFYGADPQQSPDFPRIINLANLKRLEKMLDSGNIVAGGVVDEADLYVAPTLLDDVSWDSMAMEEEIFGPILPIIGYHDINEVFRRIRKMPKALAGYIFTEKKSLQQRFVEDLDFGGGCVNDTVAHFGNLNLPFGGVGSSGVGAYHGKYSFDTFSHQKGMHYKTTWVDVPLRYPPYEGKLSIIKAVIN